MRDANRIRPLMDLITQIWSSKPDLRLGQILTNAAVVVEGPNDIFYLEDDVLLEGLVKFQKGLKVEVNVSRTIFIPNGTIASMLVTHPGIVLEELEKTLGYPCEHQSDYPHPDGGEVDVVIVSSPDAKVSELSNAFSSKLPYWRE
jgi:hypothetical protein